MKIPAAFLGCLVATAQAYFTMVTYAPSVPDVHNKAINARNRAFKIGSAHPTTHCGLDDKTQCPDGRSTLINKDMTLLAAQVPGGQFIFVAPDGNVSYPAAHSSLRPPGSQMGGFRETHVVSDCNMPVKILEWQSQEGYAGLWACPVSSGRPLTKGAVLKASSVRFSGTGCAKIDGIQIQPAGEGFGAWEYT